MQNPKAYHSAVLASPPNSKEIWQHIRQNAQRYERYQIVRTLDLLERAGFILVEEYVAAKQTYKRVWRELLNLQAEMVAEHYLGTPKARNGNTWRYGSNKGSLIVNISGSKLMGGKNYVY